VWQLGFEKKRCEEQGTAGEHRRQTPAGKDAGDHQEDGPEREKDGGEACTHAAEDADARRCRGSQTLASGRSSEREGLAAGQSLATNGEDRGVDGELQATRS
jgi:hypothetical protein